METFNLLSRATCFLTPTKGVKKKYHIITSAHVTHPYLFTNYYPYEFLKFISESDTEYKLESRNPENGQLLCEFEISKNVYKHPILDLSVCHFEHEDEFDAVKDRLGIGVFPFSKNKEQVNDEVQLVGYDIVDIHSDVQKVVSTHGKVTLMEKDRTFAKTEKQVVMGMCGCPVLNTEEECVGVLEGRVEMKERADRVLTETQRFLEGQAVILKASVVSQFLEEVNEKLKEEERAFEEAWKRWE